MQRRRPIKRKTRGLKVIRYSIQGVIATDAVVVTDADDEAQEIAAEVVVVVYVVILGIPERRSSDFKNGLPPVVVCGGRGMTLPSQARPE